MNELISGGMDKGEGGLLGAHTVLRPELDLLASISEAGSSVFLTFQPLLLLSEGCEPSACGSWGSREWLVPFSSYSLFSVVTISYSAHFRNDSLSMGFL